jgi:hypothetical protein
VSREILTASVRQEDNGDCYVTVVDYLNDTTMEGQLPEQYVGMLPMIMSQLQRNLS